MISPRSRHRFGTTRWLAPVLACLFLSSVTTEILAWIPPPEQDPKAFPTQIPENDTETVNDAPAPAGVLELPGTHGGHGDDDGERGRESGNESAPETGRELGRERAEAPTIGSRDLPSFLLHYLTRLWEVLVR